MEDEDNVMRSLDMSDDNKS